ncbi:MAG: ATP-binding cassette domain-containing protein, partial [Acidobacteriota bacterium]
MLGRFWGNARAHRSAFILGVALLLATNALSLWIPWLMRDAVHAIERGSTLAQLSLYGLGIIAVAIAQAIVRTASRWTILGASRRIVYTIRQRFFAHLLRLGASFYDSHRTGDIMSRGINDLQLLRSFYGPGVMNFLNTLIVYTAVMVLLFRIDFTLAIVSVVVYPLLFAIANRLSRGVYARSMAVQEQLATISSRAQENLSGIQQVKIYAQEEREAAAFAKLCAELRTRTLSMARLRGAMLAVFGTAAGLSTLIVLFVGGGHVIEGRITFGDFVAFNGYLGLLVWPTIAFGWIINVFQRGAGAMERLEQIFRQQPDIDPVHIVDGKPVDGDVEIRGLSFSYGEAQGASGRAMALDDITMTIRRGSRVAIVGPVGAGKSTLLNLIARVYPAPRGTIFIGGHDILDLPTASLRRGIGYVPQ